MSTICLAATALYLPKAAGHFWVYLNWALGFQANGCKVIWLEEVKGGISQNETRECVQLLKQKLAPYGLDNHLALWQADSEPLAVPGLFGCISAEAAAKESDLILNQDYVMPASVMNLFRRTALL